MLNCIQANGGKMTDNDELKKLEAKRNALYKKIMRLGDLRKGTISVNYRKCGKQNCKCAKPGHPGHGPQYLWTTTIKGKSHAKNLKIGPELQKYKDETDNYRRFNELCRDIILVNEKICDLRPPLDMDDKEAEALKKKLRLYFRQKLKKK
jgi:hypothetical protein